jgi:hypothetical protein
MIPTTPQAGTGGGDGNCGAESHEAMIKPLAIYLVVDWSASMTEAVGQDRWLPVSTALQTFVNDPASAGIEVGMGYFPVENADTAIKCDSTQYVTPAVPVGMLPETATAITTSLTSKMYTLGMSPTERLSTPTAPAITGSVEYFTGWLNQHPDHVGVMVLATDGEPALCDAGGGIPGFPTMGGGAGRGTPQELADTVAAITAAAGGMPEIKTYVIGIGDLMDALDQMAAAGDTGHEPFIVDGTGTNTQAEFLQAMQEIRGAALPCSYSIPTPTAGVLDYDKVNVDYQSGASTGTATVPFIRVENEAACGTNANAWYYDDPTNPSSIELCPAACDSVRDMGANNLSVVSVSLGCETRVL